MDVDHIKSEIQNTIDKLQGILASFTPESPVEPSQQVESQEFKSLKELLESPSWPSAVEPYLICDAESEQEKIDRAIGVLELVVSPVKPNLKFLDFGCGEGHIAKLAPETIKSSVSIGYDISMNSSKLQWETLSDHLLTTDMNKVKEYAPYDIVLLYDVLDHAVDPVYILKTIKSITTETSNIIVRTHPWCSRHASHAYRDINKAFIQLVFNDEELISLGIQETYPQKIKHPIVQYKRWFKEAGLKIKSSTIEKDTVDTFFTSEKLIANRLCELYKQKEVPVFQMMQSFHDYLLSH